MPSPKRWFPVSHDLFDDPEVWEFIRTFGDRALLTALWFLSGVDRNDNHFRLSGDWLASVSRRLRQTSASIQRQLGWMLAKDWLKVDQTAADGSPTVLSAPNYWKYHRRREPKCDKVDSTAGTSLDSLLSDPSLSEPTKEKKGAGLASPSPARSVSSNGHSNGDGRDLVAEAEQVLSHLNTQTGHRYQFREAQGKLTANAEFIIARLKSGASVQQCEQVIA